MTSTEQRPISILLVEDHEMTRMGLRSLLNSFSHVTVSGEAETAGDAIKLAEKLKPDLVLLDIRLRNSSGFDACRAILKLDLDIRILFLTSFADDEVLFEAIASGADGYLLKEISSKALLNAIEEVVAGKSILDPAVTRRVLARFNLLDKTTGTGVRFSRLSQQEKRIVNLVAQGRTNKEIAVELGLSPLTVKNYLGNAMDKLEINRRTQVGALYMRHVQTA